MADTRQAYCQLLTRFIIFLLRISDPASGYDMPELPEAVVNSLEVLRMEIFSPPPSSGEDEEDDNLLLMVLVELWSYRYTSIGRTHFNDPTIRFIMHTQVNPDMSLKDPHQVTGIFAKFTYCMVCSLVYY